MVEWVEYRIEQNKELEKKYPPNPPNDVCKMAYMKGLLIENSFEPEVGEMNELCVRIKRGSEKTEF